jgi:mono/diheme cytochrome c family protein
MKLRAGIKAAATVVLLVVGYVAVIAQPTHSVWEGVYTKDQAALGQTVYQKNCASCHGDDLRGDGFAPPLVAEPFAARWSEGILGDLITVVKVTMPQDKPGSLTDHEYSAIVAYLLTRNGYPASEVELSGDPERARHFTFTKPAAAARE